MTRNIVHAEPGFDPGARRSRWSPARRQPPRRASRGPAFTNPGHGVDHHRTDRTTTITVNTEPVGDRLDPDDNAVGNSARSISSRLARPRPSRTIPTCRRLCGPQPDQCRRHRRGRSRSTGRSRAWSTARPAAPSFSIARRASSSDRHVRSSTSDRWCCPPRRSRSRRRQRQRSFINNGRSCSARRPTPCRDHHRVRYPARQISANGSGSYVALVAPRVSHHGDIRRWRRGAGRRRSGDDHLLPGRPVRHPGRRRHRRPQWHRDRRRHHRPQQRGRGLSTSIAPIWSPCEE